MNYTDLFCSIQYWMKNQCWHTRQNHKVTQADRKIGSGQPAPAASLFLASLAILSIFPVPVHAQNGLSSPKRVQTIAQMPATPPVTIPKSKSGSKNTHVPMLLAYLPVARPAAKPPKPVSDKAIRALSPLLDYQISSLDSSTIKAIVKAISNRDYDRAVSLRNILTDKNALSLVNWFYFRKANRHYSVAEVEKFSRSHKDWPNIATLKRNAELAALGDDQTPVDIIALFKKKRPVSKQGKIRLAIALKERGKTKRARTILLPLWHRSRLSKKQEEKILTYFGDNLSAADHEKRINYLLYHHKKKYVAAARRLFKYINKESKAVHSLRINYITKRKVSEKSFDKMSEQQKGHNGLLFNRAKWLRRRKRQTEAWDILSQPNDLMKQPPSLSALDWRERNLQIRTALNKGHAPIAYAIVARHGKLSGTKGAEANFLAGWLALRFMKNPKQALTHFSRMKKLSLDKHQKAKLHFWLGRTYSALSQPQQARKNWKIAARLSHSYYGLLSSYYTDQPPPSGLRTLPTITQKDAKSFMAKNIVKAIIIAHKTGMHSMKGRLVRHLSWKLRSPAHMALLAELTHHISKKRDIIKLAKVGIYRNFPLDIYAYPSNALPQHYQKLNTPVEKDLISALVRQESEFNRKAQSPVGARGLMQLMPGTARQVARKYNISYSKPMLTVSPSYNVMLGSALLRDLLDKYNGSYILTLIAYNAGPGRSNRWSIAFGNPGDEDIDAIDWVERIPFKETRRYVQKILSSLQYFRNRSGVAKPMRLMTDLKRGGTVINTVQASAQ